MPSASSKGLFYPVSLLGLILCTTLWTSCSDDPPTDVEKYCQVKYPDSLWQNYFSLAGTYTYKDGRLHRINNATDQTYWQYHRLGNGKVDYIERINSQQTVQEKVVYEYENNQVKNILKYKDDGGGLVLKFKYGYQYNSEGKISVLEHYNPPFLVPQTHSVTWTGNNITKVKVDSLPPSYDYMYDSYSYDLLHPSPGAVWGEDVMWQNGLPAPQNAYQFTATYLSFEGDYIMSDFKSYQYKFDSGRRPVEVKINGGLILTYSYFCP